MNTNAPVPAEDKFAAIENAVHVLSEEEKNVLVAGCVTDGAPETLVAGCMTDTPGTGPENTLVAGCVIDTPTNFLKV